MGLMPWIGKGCAWLFKLVALPFAKLGSPSVRPVLRWVLHVALVLVSIGCLTYLNIALELDKVVRAPSPILRTLWLPLLFLMVYSLAWLAWWIWKTATAAADPSQFPDIDEAWQEGLRALEQAQIDPTQTPLYLVLGRPASGDGDFFPATGLNWEVPLSPRRSDASVRICATRDAIFVSLAKISTVGLFVERLASKVASASEDTPQFAACGHALTSANSASSTVTATTVMAPKTVQRGLELIEQSLAMLQRESDEDTATEIATDAIGLTDDDLETSNRRLVRICQLIAESRTPYCPANGLVVLIPWQATESQEIANRAAVIVDRDLRTVEQELQLSMPRVTIITDIQAVPGGREMIQRMPVEQRNRRFGVRFPHLAASDVGRLPELAEQGLNWLCQQLLPGLVY
ncbi:MAG TPA: type VI secretion protein IcmF/TssM N-terminal domain-containing protein, partial [Pirellulaceae bacterium]|nr:type VI secretion protein IcmF/TssM N-terminal domain-containing protein [Pirellulaceae bacterium]